ncbi:MAG TPA: MgtC/SapB family protein [Pseudogracilibacillus sp.]|nr:MgtC/SapB family protein [Pseudogracilibacillus sp.]
MLTSFFMEYELYFKLIISAILGFLVGLDRASRKEPAGFKTYTYVAVSCTLVTIISMESAYLFQDSFPNVSMDPMRLAANVLTGLGFIGGGVILKQGMKVRGIVSAAMIFFVGGLGIGIGAGFYAISFTAVIITTVLGLFGRYFETAHLDIIIDLFSKKRE